MHRVGLATLTLLLGACGGVLGSAAATSLGTAPVSAAVIGDGPDTSCIFELGDNANHNGAGMADVAYTSLWAHGNYDTVTPGVVWSASIATRTLPASLYLAAKPAWWPTANAWPWAGPDVTPNGASMVGALPAKTRSDSLAP